MVDDRIEKEALKRKVGKLVVFFVKHKKDKDRDRKFIKYAEKLGFNFLEIFVCYNVLKSLEANGGIILKKR